jgi:hypothetical protein
VPKAAKRNKEQPMFNISSNEVHTTITLENSEGQKLKSIKLTNESFNVLTSLEVPTANMEVQRLLARANGWPLNAQGRSPKAAAILEKFTPGYGSFNGWCALLVGTSVGKSRFFHTAQDHGVEEGSVAQMLTRTGKLAAQEEQVEVEDAAE